MKKDLYYVNGAIAVRETRLLGDRIYKMCEGTFEDAFKTLQDAGFGKNAEVNNSFDYEKMIIAEEKELDAFLADCAPSKEETSYLLCPRDFYNAKTVLKAERLNLSYGDMVSSIGEFTIEYLADCIKNGKYNSLPTQLNNALKECDELFIKGEATGVKIGIIFEKYLHSLLIERCKKNRALYSIIKERIDMLNLLCSFRAKQDKTVNDAFIDGGNISKSTIIKIRNLEAEAILRYFANSPSLKFIQLLLKAKQDGEPFTDAEKYFDSFDLRYFDGLKGELKGSQTYIKYALKGKTECTNIRLIMVGLSAGMSAQDIKARLRG